MNEMTSKEKPSLYFKGKNPTADMILLRPSAEGPEVLLIVRSSKSNACPLLSAFPGGFVNAVDMHSEVHEAKETPEEAARRELEEETGLIAGKDVIVHECGVWKAPWRDPRNDDERYAVSHAFCGWVPEGYGANPQSLDDAEPGKTTWVKLSELSGQMMAFDHGIMLSAACAKLGAVDPGARSWSQERLWEKLSEKREKKKSIRSKNPNNNLRKWW